MNPDAFLAWQFQPWLSAVAALLSALACHVALELNRRVGGASLRTALPWLAGAALAWLHRGAAIVLDMVNFFCL